MLMSVTPMASKRTRSAFIAKNGHIVGKCATRIAAMSATRIAANGPDVYRPKARYELVVTSAIWSEGGIVVRFDREPTCHTTSTGTGSGSASAVAGLRLDRAARSSPTMPRRAVRMTMAKMMPMTM